MLRLREISKSFAAPVLCGVSVDFARGEIHALLGMNGAGKSTLMRIVAGSIAPDAGEIELDSQMLHLRGPADALKSGISMVYQELDLAPHLTVAENLLLGSEPARFGRISHAEEARTVRQLLQECGLPFSASTRLQRLRTGERQLVAIAKAYARAGSVLILDEPTSALNAAEVQRLFELLRKLRAGGLALIYISHRLEEVREIADRVTVLRNGSIAYSGAQPFDMPAIVRAMVGSEAAAGAFARPPVDRQIGPAVLSVESLSLSGAFHDISFDLHAGEVLALAGIVGDGRGALADTLFGLLKPTAGHIRIGGGEVGEIEVQLDPTSAVGHRVGFVPEDRGQALCPQLSAGTNVTLASVPRFAGPFHLQRSAELQLITTAFRAVGLPDDVASRPARQLSGGTQQKVVFGRWLSADSRVLVLVEPTRGVDISARLEIYRQIESWLSGGMGALVVSSDLDEIVRLANRVLVMRRGRIVRELRGPEISAEAIMLAAAGEQH